MIDTGLAGRVVVVTGANNPYGIGAATAKAFANQGARVLLHYLRLGISPTSSSGSNIGESSQPGEAFYRIQQTKSADEVLAVIRSEGGEAEAWEADLSDAAVVPALFDRAESVLGPVEVLVNNAAVDLPDTFIPPDKELSNKLVELWTERSACLSAQGFDSTFAVNARAPALLMAEFARRHIKRGVGWGRIINVSTDGAECFPSEVSYGASKLALEAYTRSAAAELGHYGITVNAVSLGPVQTGWITPDLEKAILPSIPLGRIGVPEDVADVIVFLASDQARWITGQRIYVGGGHCM